MTLREFKMDQVKQAKINPGAVPEEVYHSLARGLLEFIRKHPELRVEYEKETGKSFYR